MVTVESRTFDSDVVWTVVIRGRQDILCRTHWFGVVELGLNKIVWVASTEPWKYGNLL